MDFLSAAVVGLLQGLLEWLPVSSSGQTMLYFLDVLGLDAKQAFSLGLFLHLGTSAAVLVKYRKTWLDLVNDMRTLRFLLVTTAFTGVTGLGIYFLLKNALDGFNGTMMNAMIGGLLVLTGFVLYAGRKKGFGRRKLADLNFWEEAIVGLVQGFTILPGISRSGATVSTLALSEVEQGEALRLSFLMSVPAVAGALVLETATEGIPTIGLGAAFAGVLASFVGGYVTMEALVSWSKKVRFDLFCVLFGLVAVVGSLTSLF